MGIVSWPNGRLLGFDSSKLLQRWLENESSYIAGELYLIDAGQIPLAPGWECNIWGEPI